MNCPACSAAETNPAAGLQISGCYGCDVRAISILPKRARERYYAGIADPAERSAFAAAVSAEFERRQKLRGRAA